MTEPSAYHCPLCERRFTNELARLQHLLTTAKHESIIEAYLRVAFLLADCDESIAVARQQRDAALQERDATLALLRLVSAPEHSKAASLVESSDAGEHRLRGELPESAGQVDPNVVALHAPSTSPQA